MKFDIPENMKAVFIKNSVGELTIKNIPVPHPGPGEVLIKIAAAPVNPSDLIRINDMLNQKEIYSFIPGIEGSGRVVEAGRGIIPRLWLGKRVACSSTSNTSGTWAEYMITSASRCFPVSNKIDDEQSSMLLVNPMTAVAFFDIIKRGRHKAIINSSAAGALGRMIELLGSKFHVPVINIVRKESQKTFLETLGSKYVITSSNENFPNELKELAQKLNATLAFDAVGGKHTNQLLKAIPNGGIVMVYGNLSGEQPEIDHRSLVRDNKKVSGFYLGNWIEESGSLRTMRNIFLAKKLLKSQLKIKINKRYPLEKIQEAINQSLEHMTEGKVVIIPKSGQEV